MIIPDLNLLIYAHDTLSPCHAAAKRWWADSLSQSEPVGLPHLVVFGFIRISTRSQIFRQPLTLTEAGDLVRSWLAQPNVQMVQPADGHLDRVMDLLDQIGTAGNLVTDAQLAALAIEHHAVLHTTDTDFVRFPGLQWFNPITGLGSESLRKSRRR
jgi:toxin-antitoxin system PIN domain toxin